MAVFLVTDATSGDGAKTHARAQQRVTPGAHDVAGFFREMGGQFSRPASAAAKAHHLAEIVLGWA